MAQYVDVTIGAGCDAVCLDDFTKTPEMVRAGEEAAMKMLPEIRAAIEGRRRE